MGTIWIFVGSMPLLLISSDADSGVTDDSVFFGVCACTCHFTHNISGNICMTTP